MSRQYFFLLDIWQGPPLSVGGKDNYFGQMVSLLRSHQLIIDLGLVCSIGKSNTSSFPFSNHVVLHRSHLNIFGSLLVDHTSSLHSSNCNNTSSSHSLSYTLRDIAAWMYDVYSVFNSTKIVEYDHYIAGDNNSNNSRSNNNNNGDYLTDDDDDDNNNNGDNGIDYESYVDSVMKGRRAVGKYVYSQTKRF